MTSCGRLLTETEFAIVRDRSTHPEPLVRAGAIATKTAVFNIATISTSGSAGLIFLSGRAYITGCSSASCIVPPNPPMNGPPGSDRARAHRGQTGFAVFSCVLAVGVVELRTGPTGVRPGLRFFLAFWRSAWLN